MNEEAEQVPATAEKVESPQAESTPWPEAPAGSDIVFLLEAANPFELELLETWVARTRPEGASTPTTIPLPASRRGGNVGGSPALEIACAANPDAVLAPLRVVWFPEQRGGDRRARAKDLLLGDPRDPGALRGRWILRQHPERMRLIAGAPATVGEVRSRWTTSGTADLTGLAAFVHRQAIFALERQERHLRGARYKVPRLVRSEVLGRPRFRATLSQIAAKASQSESAVVRYAEKCLREMAGAHSAFSIDLTGALFELIFSRGYEAPPEFDLAQLEEIVALTEKTPVAFVFTHRSHLDAMAIFSILHSSGFPPSHTIGGENMAVFPIGMLGRRSGIVFIRRKFGDDKVYKATIREYLSYLLEKRFTLAWALEGARSRSGKLMPPRLGILAYVVDAWRNGAVDDVTIVPVSISYDQIVELADYAKEERGGKKRAESFSWFLGFVSGIRAPHGRMYVRFGERVSLRKYFDAPAAPLEDIHEGDPEDVSIDLHKLAFDLSVRLNQATRVTSSSLLSTVMLGTGRQAITLAEIHAEAAPLADFAKSRDLPGASELGMQTLEDTRQKVLAMVDGGVIKRHEDGPDPVYSIQPNKHHSAAYYRNTVLHFLLPAAFAEVCLMSIARRRAKHRLEALRPADGDDLRLTATAPTVPDSARAVLSAEIASLRDFFKFEFFFPERLVFEEQVLAEILRTDPQWESRYETVEAAMREWFERRSPLVAHGTLRSYLEGYRIVAEQLMRRGVIGNLDEPQFLNACARLADQRILQGRVTSYDASSKETLKNGLQLAKHRGLLRPDGEAGRQAFLDYSREACRHLDVIAGIVSSRRIDPFT